MALPRLIFLYATFLSFLGCGNQGASTDDEYQLIASQHPMNVSSLFFCETSISSETNQDFYNGLLYTDSDLNVTIAIVYSVFYGTNPASTERIVRGEVSLSEDSSNTLTFKQSSTIYSQSNSLSQISVNADVSNNDGSNDGTWTFSVNSDAAGLVYSDGDLSEPISYTFLVDDETQECLGEVKNDPTS